MYLGSPLYMYTGVRTGFLDLYHVGLYRIPRSLSSHRVGVIIVPSFLILLLIDYGAVAGRRSSSSDGCTGSRLHI